MEGRSWKNLSHKFGWKVKTHGKCFFPYLLILSFTFPLEFVLILLLSGFPIRGVSSDAVVASRVSLERAQEIILCSSSKRKADTTQDSEEEEEQDGGSLIKRMRVRRRVFSNDEATPPRSVPITEPFEATLVSYDDTPATARDSDDQLFSRGFHNDNLDLVLMKYPLPLLPCLPL